MALTTWHTFFPLNLEEICQEGHIIYKHFEQTFQQHFAFESYKVLVERGSIPDLATSYANGSLCKDFVRNYVSFVSVESPSTSVMKSRREKRVSFNDQLGIIGGTFGLFTGLSLLGVIEVLLSLYSLIKSIIMDFMQVSFTQNLQDELISSDLDEKDSTEDHQMNCCNREKAHHIERHSKNLHVSN